MRFFLLNLLGVVTPLLFLSCATPQKLDPAKFYKRDMKIEVNGLKGEGVLVVPRYSSYKMDIRSAGKLDLFTFETCHREETKEDAGEDGLFGDRKRVQLEYRPLWDMEDRGACPVRLGGYERTEGKHSWGLIDFETSDAGLVATLRCNGKVTPAHGVSVCQSREGLIQQIEFAEEVIVNPDPGCEMPRPVDLKTYRFTMSLRECVFNFMAKSEGHAEHRLTTIGYNEVPIREGE